MCQSNKQQQEVNNNCQQDMMETKNQNEGILQWTAGTLSLNWVNVHLNCQHNWPFAARYSQCCEHKAAGDGQSLCIIQHITPRRSLCTLDLHIPCYIVIIVLSTLLHCPLHIMVFSTDHHIPLHIYSFHILWHYSPLHIPSTHCHIPLYIYTF